MPLAVAAWAAAWLGTGSVPAGIAIASAGGAAALAAAILRRSALLLTVALIIVAVLCAGLVNVHRLRHGPVAALAAHRAVVSAEVEIRADPHRIAGSGPRASAAVMKAATVRLAGRGGAWLVRAPLLLVVSGPEFEQWFHVPVGSRVRVDGRMEVAEPGSDVAAVLRVRGSPAVVKAPRLA